MRKLLMMFSLIFAHGASAQSFSCGDSLLDVRDGKKYATVLIGAQCWMQQNLNYGQFVQSTTSASQHSNVANNFVIEKYCQNNDSAYCDTLGGLYDWNELMNYSSVPGQGICPNGWHMPTDAEFGSLVAISGNNGNSLKLLGQGMAPWGIGTNSTGFSATAGGDRDGLGVFYGMDLRFIFWTATEANAGSAWQYTLFAEDDSIAHLGDAGKPSGFSVRCLKDAGPSGLQEGLGNAKFMVFPNPSSDKIWVQSLSNVIVESMKIQIFEVDGHLLRSYLFQSFPIEMNISDVKKGIYLLELQNGETIEVKKVVIQ